MKCEAMSGWMFEDAAGVCVQLFIVAIGGCVQLL